MFSACVRVRERERERKAEHKFQKEKEDRGKVGIDPIGRGWKEKTIGGKLADGSSLSLDGRGRPAKLIKS